MKLPYTEVNFHPEVKSQTSLSWLWVPCKRALRLVIFGRFRRFDDDDDDDDDDDELFLSYSWPMKGV